MLKKETPKGYWICFDKSSSWKKWIPKKSLRRFAYPSKEEAFLNFQKRTERRIEILKHQIEVAKIALQKLN